MDFGSFGFWRLYPKGDKICLMLTRTSDVWTKGQSTNVMLQLKSVFLAPAIK